jgi:exopolysaccharide biosynthesis polyprenyl glycosylphosphotransferase
MFKRFHTDFAVFSIVLDTCLIALALVASVTLRPSLPPVPFSQPLSEVHLPGWLYVLVPLLWTTVFFLTSVYDPKHTYKVVEEFQRVTIATGFSALSLAGLLFLSFRDFSRWLFVLFVSLALVFLLSWRVIARLSFRLSNAPPARSHVLIVGAGELGQRVAQMVREYAWTGLEVVGFLDDDPAKRQGDLPVLGTLAHARQVILGRQVDDVVIALPRRANERLNQLVSGLHDLPVHVRVVPDYFALALYRAAAEDFAGIPMIDLRAPALNDVQRLSKRLFDLVVGGMLFFLALPFMSLAALAIKLDSPGPILFRQKRVGENGRIFPIYKFRTMVNGAPSLQDRVNTVDDQGHIIHKTAKDPRVTRVGRFLRRFSVDELPQLLNVLRGEMSLVGPRPELPWLVDKYEPWQRKRFAVAPGMTGWWQVSGRSNKPMHLNTEDDLYYIQNYSLLLDLFILWKTIWVVLRGEGAF